MTRSVLARRLLALVSVLFVALAPPAATHAALHARPIPAISRALLVSVDGLRPDLLLRADSPVLHDLVRRGSFTFWATTTPVAVTLPSHTSMLTGVPVSKHGIEWNWDIPLKEPVWPARPTLFEVAKHAGLTTAMITGKSKFATLAKPGSLDWVVVPKETVTDDSSVATQAVSVIQQHAPQVLFVHLPTTDITGHDKGWGSPEQMTAIAGADRAIGRILDALRARGVLDSTLVLVSSDHGGAGTTHGPDDPRSRHIPWIAAGPGIRAGYDLTLDADLAVRTEDTFATICWVLGLRPEKAVDGRPVRQIAADPKLRADAATP